MKWKLTTKILLAILIVMAISVTTAYDFDPGRDINLRDIYDIKNAADIDTACLNLSGDYRCAWLLDPEGIPVHNQLSGLQGGTTNQYYHLNQSVHDTVISNFLSWITAAFFDQDLNTTDSVTFVNITANNITADYYYGQPIDGGVGSGIINSSSNKAACACINASDMGGLNVWYPDLIVRIWNFGDTIYCDIPNATVQVPDNDHQVYYVDNSCSVSNMTWASYFAKDLNPANFARIFDAYTKNGEIEVVKGSTLIALIDRKTRWVNVNCGQGGHLTVCDGIAIQENTFPDFNQTSGHYNYVHTVHTSAFKQASVDGIHITVASDEIHTAENGINLSACDDSVGAAVCSDNKYRRYLIYTIGFGEQNTKIHQLAPPDAAKYNNIGDCLNFEKYPFTYTLPEDEYGVAVIHHVYCGRRDDASWSGAWVDLRGDDIFVGAGIDTSIFLTSDGDTPLTDNWDAGAFNITAHWFKGLFNWTEDSIYLTFDGTVLSFSESQLNTTIDARAGMYYAGGNYLYLNASDYFFVNETVLNATIDSRAGEVYFADEVYINLNDSNSFNLNETVLNQSIDARSSILNVNSSDYWNGLGDPSDILGSQINNDLNWINETTAESDPYWTANSTNVAFTNIDETFDQKLTVAGDFVADPSVNVLYVNSTSKRVGIGITNPAVKLTVYDGNLLIERSDAQNAILRLKNSNDENQIYTHSTTGDLRFWNGADLVTIEPGGNFGIGTTSPQNLLNVLGDANVTGTLYYGVLDGEADLNVNSSDYWDGLGTVSDVLGSAITNDLNWINGTLGNATYILQSEEANLNVNSSDFWDGLNTTSDINAADITDDNTYVTVAGDTMTGNLNMGNKAILNINWSGSDDGSGSELDADMLDGYESGFFMPLNTSPVGTFGFNGGWAAGGLTISGGDLYAQKIYVYNITSLNVTEQDLTIVDDLVVYGNTDLKQNLTVDTNTLFVDSNTNMVGIGTNAPDSIFHIKANVAGTVGSHPAGQLIIQDPDDSVFGNAVITGYESDGAGNPDQQLWYLGSSSSSNSNIIFLNRRNAKLQLGTYGVSRLTILGDGNVGINTTTPQNTLNVVGDGNFTAALYAATLDTGQGAQELYGRLADLVAGTGIGGGGNDVLYGPDGDVSLNFDCSEVEGTGIDCAGEAITLDATGDWTGTLDSIEGASFLRSDAADVWNDAGSSIDFRMESDTNVNMFFLDGSANKIGMGTSSPSQVLDVVGGLQIGNTSTAESGAIRWNDPYFQGYNGTDWMQLSGDVLLIDELDIVSNTCDATTCTITGIESGDELFVWGKGTTGENYAVTITLLDEWGTALDTSHTRIPAVANEAVPWSVMSNYTANQTSHTFNITAAYEIGDIKIMIIAFKTVGLGEERWVDEAGDTMTGELKVLDDINFTGLIYGNGSQLTDVGAIYTAGDALTLTGTEFDFDGGASPGGELGGTWASPTVDSGIHDDEYVSRDTWTDIDDYPTGCSAGQAVRIIGDTLTCIEVGGEVTDVWVNESGDTMSGDLDLGDNDLENIGTVYHDDTTRYLSRVTSDGTDGGTLYDIGTFWNTTDNFLHFRGYSGIALGVQESEKVRIATSQVTINPNLVVQYIAGPGWEITTGALGTFGKLNTGQGANELYAMNQDVETTDNPQFAGVKLDASTHYLGSGAATSNLYVLYVNEMYGDVGSISDPSYMFDGDGNTGLYQAVADQVGVTLGGVMRATFKANYFEVKPSTDSYGIIVRDSGSSSYANLQNINGITYLKDQTSAGLAISGTAVSVPDHGTGTTDMLSNVVYSDSACPTASTTTIGTICVVY